jgi:hypothetical protein
MRYGPSLLTWSLLGLLCLGSYFWVGTHLGLRLTVRGVQAVLPGRLEIIGIKGALIGPIQCQSIRYEDEAYHVYASHIQLDWKKTDFLRGCLCIRQFAVQTVKVDIKQKSIQNPQAQPIKLTVPQLPGWMHAMRVLKASIKQFQLNSSTLNVNASGELGMRCQLKWTLAYTPLHSKKHGQSIFQLEGHLEGEGLTNPSFSIEGHSVHPFSIQTGQVDKSYTVTIPCFQMKAFYRHEQWIMRVWDGDEKQNEIEIMIQPPQQNTKYLSRLRQPIQAKLNVQISHWLTLSKMGLPLEQWGVDPHSGRLRMECMVETTVRYLERCLEYPEQYIFKQDRFHLSDETPLRIQADLQWDNPIVTGLGMHLNRMHLTGDFKQDDIQWDAQLVGHSIKTSNATYLMQWKIKGKTLLNWVGANASLATAPVQMNTQLHLTGDALPLFTHTAYAFSLAPKLDIDYHHNELTVAGEVEIPTARLDLQYTDAGATVDKDIVLVNDTHPQQGFSLPFKVDVNVKLGKAVYFNYGGLKTRLEGELHLLQPAKGMLSAKGEIQFVDGHYYYYGQALKVEPYSRLIFTEWLYNPKIDIDATRFIYIKPSQTIFPGTQLYEAGVRIRPPTIQPTIDTRLPMCLKVGVRLRGDIEEPDMTLFSSPPGWVMDPADNLAYILTGQPVSRLNTAAMPLLFNALTQMGTGYMNYHGTAAYIKNKLGVEWDVQAEQLTTKTHLILTKHFTSKWSISCKLGLRNPDRMIKASYLFNPALLIEGNTSNTGMGIDLVYQKEFG